MTASDWAAWWGAVIATVVLAWDAYKWNKSRSNIRVSASPNMQSLNELIGRLEDDKYIFVEVVNNGNKGTTITHLVVKHYNNRFDWLRRKPSLEGLVPRPGGYQPLPYELESGKRWTAMMDQKDLEEKMKLGGILYCGIYHSASKKPKLVRVRFE